MSAAHLVAATVLFSISGIAFLVPIFMVADDWDTSGGEVMLFWLLSAFCLLVGLCLTWVIA